MTSNVIKKVRIVKKAKESLGKSRKVKESQGNLRKLEES